MDINPLVDCFRKQVLVGIERQFRVAQQDSDSGFNCSLTAFSAMQTFGSMDFIVGNNISGYMGASYDITDYIRFGRENVLVVRVDATQYEGWFYEGAGIYRHVWLNQYNNIHISDDGVFVYQ